MAEVFLVQVIVAVLGRLMPAAIGMPAKHCSQSQFTGSVWCANPFLASQANLQEGPRHGLCKRRAGELFPNC